MGEPRGSGGVAVRLDDREDGAGSGDGREGIDGAGVAEGYEGYEACVDELASLTRSFASAIQGGEMPAREVRATCVCFRW
jgi:hypothetical protein